MCNSIHSIQSSEIACKAWLSLPLYSAEGDRPLPPLSFLPFYLTSLISRRTLRLQE